MKPIKRNTPQRVHPDLALRRLDKAVRCSSGRFRSEASAPCARPALLSLTWKVFLVWRKPAQDLVYRRSSPEGCSPGKEKTPGLFARALP
jgi:hypothetical protein